MSEQTHSEPSRTAPGIGKADVAEAALGGPGSGATRDRMLDGFRAIAVLGVIAGHAGAFRFGEIIANAGPARHLLRLASPLAEAGVYLFFAISGYIITTLMLREEARDGRFSLLAFYVRRSLRIIPPLAVFLATLALLGANGLIRLDAIDLASAAAFTCNTGWTPCGWFVAHTWSLAVEEQYYLVWPLLFTLLALSTRPSFAAAVTLALTAMFLILPWDWHSNAISFACIAAGATMALRPRWREALERAGNSWSWPLAAAIAIARPLVVGLRAIEASMPLLTVFLLFGGRRLGWLRAILEAKPLQAIGAMSYSLYLWQQLFLAAPASYPMGPPPLWLLPIVAWLSLIAIERPFIRLAHRLSRGVVMRGSLVPAGASA